MIESSFSIPKRRYNIKDKIKEIYEALFNHFETNREKQKISFAEFSGKSKEEKVILFSSLLHLDNQKKVWLEQNAHFGEINIWLSKTYFKHNPDYFKDLM